MHAVKHIPRSSGTPKICKLVLEVSFFLIKTVVKKKLLSHMVNMMWRCGPPKLFRHISKWIKCRHIMQFLVLHIKIPENTKTKYPPLYANHNKYIYI